jgi:hypothetical protein
MNYSPFINFRSGPAADSLRFPTNSAESQMASASGSSLDSGRAVAWTKLNRKGHGSRHVYDTFPFSLWIEEDHDYRSLTTEEARLIIKTYEARGVSITPPFIVVTTATPPKQVPLTIGCAPAYFISPQTHDSGWAPGIPFGNGQYAHPRVKNPFPECIRRPWQHPPASDVEIIANRLLDLCNVESLVFCYPFLTVVLKNDGRSYEKHSLPGRVGFWGTTYYQGEAGLWKQWPLSRENRNREMTPDRNAGIEDTSNYLISSGFLSPGVRLAGLEKSTSCGVRVKNSNTEAIRITCANQGFLVNDDVYHPDETGTLIGKIKERYEDEDIALFELDAIVPFKNDSYFDAALPKRLLKEDELRKLKGAWFEADGMSTGMVAFLNSGVVHHIPPRRPNDYHAIPYCQYTTQIVWNTVGAVGNEQLADGICGAAIVQCDNDSEGSSEGDSEGADASLGGGVAGFFQLSYGGGACGTPVLDKLIMDGWELH